MNTLTWPKRGLLRAGADSSSVQAASATNSGRRSGTVVNALPAAAAIAAGRR